MSEIGYCGWGVFLLMCSLLFLLHEGSWLYGLVARWVGFLLLYLFVLLLVGSLLLHANSRLRIFFSLWYFLYWLVLARGVNTVCAFSLDGVRKERCCSYWGRKLWRVVPVEVRRGSVLVLSYLGRG